MAQGGAVNISTKIGITKHINSDNLQRCLACVFAALNFTQAKHRCKFPVMGDVMCKGPWKR